VRLYLHSWGERSSPPVVCVHGVCGHGARFRKLAQERLAATHRVLSADLRGHGHSGWEPPWNLEAHVADLIETADAAGAGHAAWVGFSFGGRLVAELALRAPERVERVALLDPALELPPVQAMEQAEQERLEETYASAEAAIEARLAAGTLLSTPRALLEEEMREHLVPGPGGRLAFRYSKSAAVAAWGEMARPAPPVTRVPTLLLLGGRSYIPNAFSPERYRAELGDLLDLRRIESGHSLLWDAFEETAGAVADFLAP
jgi:lipase